MSQKKLIFQPIEILSLTAGCGSDGTPVVMITIRPHPAYSPQSKLVAITREQAQRVRDDLDTIFNDDNITWRDE